MWFFDWLFLLWARLRSSVQTEKGQEVIQLSPLPTRAKRTYLAMDADRELIGYVVPLFRGRWVGLGRDDDVVDSWDGRCGGESSNTGLQHTDEEEHGDGAEVMIVIYLFL